MTQPEFVRIDSQAMRVTSLKRDEETGQIHLVIIARGTAAAQVLRDIAGKPTVTLEIPDEAAETCINVETDFRTTGEGEQSMNRVRFTLDPRQQINESESQLDRIERKLDQLLAIFNK